MKGSCRRGLKKWKLGLIHASSVLINAWYGGKTMIPETAIPENTP